MFHRMTSGLADIATPDVVASEGSVSGASSARRWWQWPRAFHEPDADIRRNLTLPRGINHNNTLFGPSSAPSKVPTWKPEYSHPQRAEPGFLHHFAPAEDEAGPNHAESLSASAAAVETTLVCARCLDPLVLAVPHDASEDERKKHRVWALRCGHMLDGKCITDLYAPPRPIPVVEVRPIKDIKGKGKARSNRDFDAHAPPFEPLADGQPGKSGASSTDSKRKHKRKAAKPFEAESLSPSKRTRFAEPAEAEVISTRSRLRSHARLVATADTAPEEAASTATSPQPSLAWRSGRSAASGSGRGTGRGKGKGKGNALKKPAIDAEHEWKCPVTNCGRVHYAVQVQGEWENDEGRGATALFV